MKLEWIGWAIGLVAAGFPFWAMLAVASLVQRRWIQSLERAAGSLLFLVLAMILFATASALWVLPQDDDPSQRARILAERVSTLMNSAAWTTLLGLPAGIVAVVLGAHKKSRLPIQPS